MVRQAPFVKLEPSVGQETRFGCEIEDCGSGEYQHKESLEFLFVKPLGCRVNDSAETVWRRPRDTAGDLWQFCL